MKTAAGVLLHALAVSRSPDVPLYRQIYDALRNGILDRSLAPGSRFPASRTLAEELGVSRMTVMNAYDQLLAEGYVKGKIGAGTFVSEDLPELPLRGQKPATPAKDVRRPPSRSRSLSRRGRSVISHDYKITPAPEQSRPFHPGRPDFGAFPFANWARIVARTWARRPANLLGYSDPLGYPPLREAISSYLRTARGVNCVPEQVLIVAGAQQALDLSVRLLTDSEESVWIEEPGYIGARAALQAAGARLVPVPVDDQGLRVDAGLARSPSPRLIYVTPSHQLPLGMTLSLARRLALLDLARRTRAWILEDDYDSEFRYVGRPIAALQGLDQDGLVIYFGTFSKVLFPALRIGYLVVPQQLVSAFSCAHITMNCHFRSFDQAVLAQFINEGHFARHVRRMRTLYAQRQNDLLKAAKKHLRGLLTVDPTAAGMHLIGWLPKGMSDQEVCRKASEAGVIAKPLSAFYLQSGSAQGLILGFAAFQPDTIAAGVKRLAGVIRDLRT